MKTGDHEDQRNSSLKGEWYIIEMRKIVQKFGGTSVGDIYKIKKAAEIIAKEYTQGSAVIAVVSAMSGVTNKLIKLTQEICDMRSTDALAEHDVVTASGEQVTSGLLALALQSIGFKSRSFAGWQLPIVTDDAYSNGRIMSVGTDAITQVIKNGEIPVIAGLDARVHVLDGVGDGHTLLFYETSAFETSVRG